MSSVTTEPRIKVGSKLTHEIYEITGVPTENSTRAIQIFTHERKKQGFGIYPMLYYDGHAVQPEDEGALHSFYIRVPVGRFEEIREEIEALASTA